MSRGKVWCKGLFFVIILLDVMEILVMFFDVIMLRLDVEEINFLSVFEGNLLDVLVGLY